MLFRSQELKPEGPNWFTQAQSLLAHAIAAGHLHDAQRGKAAAEALEASVAPYPKLKVGSPSATLPDQIRAWALFSQSDLSGAIALLRPVADRQDKIGKGEVELPAREMLAEMLLLSGKFGDALSEYQVSLISDPNRFNALLGAGEAAEGLGENNVAAGYYRILLANCVGANGNALMVLRHPQMVVNEVARPATEIGSSPSN